MATRCSFLMTVIATVVTGACCCSGETRDGVNQARSIEAATSSPRPGAVCAERVSEVNEACRGLCQKVIDSCFGSESLAFGVSKVYGLDVQPLRSGASDCTNACLVGRDEQTNSASLAPTRCGVQLITLLACVTDTGTCGADWWSFSCTEEVSELKKCASDCGALLACDPIQCSGVVLSGDVQGDLGCPAHCTESGHCARTYPDACYP
jgi:hypothetical protein